MRISFVTVGLIVLGVAAGRIPVRAQADVADLPLALQSSQSNAAPQVNAVADVPAPTAQAGSANATQSAAEPTGTAPASQSPALAQPEPEADGAKPWKLPEPSFLKDMRIEQYGWLDRATSIR